MTDRAARQFLRWRERGDAAALAAVFDRTAPELLRLGLHLCGNTADAEDLLQATFLAAIESALKFERGRRLMPWLVAILTHAAHAERRRQRRAPQNGAEPDAAAGPHVDPAEQSAVRELSQAGLMAIDRLPEPYRQPTMLRLVQGMEPADIALLLGRSPGSVRSQVHRGIEQLRRQLPAFVAALPRQRADCSRGIAAVKGAVLAHANAHTTVAATGALLTGGMLMTKKTIAAAALLLCGLAAVLGITFLGSEPEATSDQGALPRAADVQATSLAPAASPPPPDAAAVRTPAASDPVADAFHLRARVVDGKGGTPIAGAAIAVFAPRELSLLELQREFGAYGRPLPTGNLTSAVEWLRGTMELPVAVTLGGARHGFLVPPADGAQPIAETTSADDGTFLLPVAKTEAIVLVSYPGYGRRCVPLERSPADEMQLSGVGRTRDAAGDFVTTIQLWPLQRFHGEVRTLAGEAPGVPLQLLLTDASAGSGAWLAQVDKAGRFTVEVAASMVRVWSRTPGWIATPGPERAGAPSVRGSAPRIETTPGATVFVKRFGCARLHVTDAQDGRPVQDLWLTSRDQHGMPRHCGRFWAPDGYLALSSWEAEDIAERPSAMAGSFPNQATATVWSKGYRPAPVGQLALFAEEPAVVEVRLERGGLERLTGRIQRGSKPVAGATVQLRFFDRGNRQKGVDLMLAAMVTGTTGAFTLEAPAGEHELEVVTAGTTAWQCPVALPHAEPLVVDLADVVMVTVEVVDAEGHPVPGHNVSVTGPGGHGHPQETDGEGRATLGPFQPGTLTAFAPITATKGSWHGQLTAKVEAAAGSRPVARLTLPPKGPFRVRLCFEGPQPEQGFAGFRVRAVHGANTDTVAVDASGTVPLDVTPKMHLAVTGPGGRQWRFVLPDQLQRDSVLLLRWQGLAYQGTLLDGAGAPVANGRVFATPVGDGLQVSVTTDAAGAFRLDGLEPRRYLLGFNTDHRSPWRETDGNPLRMALFETTDVPAAVPVLLQPRVPRYSPSGFAGHDDVEVTGKVRAQGGSPVANATISIESLLDQPGGVLHLFPRNGWKQTDQAGGFTQLVARAERYRVSLGREGSRDLKHEEWRPATTAAKIEHDFVLR